MKEMSQQARLAAFRTLGFIAKYRLPLEIATILFVAASTFDVLMTRYLITECSSTGMSFVESNPIARYFLDSWGVEGLTWFKFSLVALVIAICQVIARHKIHVARRVLNFSTLLVSGVVLYSLLLLARNS